MPANPHNVRERRQLSQEYSIDVTIDFYTNNAIAIYRGHEDDPEGRIWLDNLEKRELLQILKKEIENE